MEKFLEKLKKKENLNFEESKSVFETIMSGQAEDDQIYDFLIFVYRIHNRGWGRGRGAPPTL